MAATILKRSAAIWVPPRSIGERAFASEPHLLVMTPSGNAGATTTTRASLDALPAIRSATLVFDARDVTLVAANLPALGPAKLARALPNLLEDQLLQDAQACAFALGARLPDGRRVVGVIDRGWLEFVIGAFERRGVRVAQALPAQLALPLADGRCSIACVNGGLAVRAGEAEGFGWTASDDSAARSEAIGAALASAAHSGAHSGAPLEGVDVFAESADWRQSAEDAAAQAQLAIDFSPLPVPQPGAMDLASARQGTAGSRWLQGIDWRAWRIPAAIAGLALVAWLAGLNMHWAALANERAALRERMELTFHETFPSAQVVVDPLLQMQRQVSDLRLRSGQSGPADFLPLLTRFSEALGPRASDALASVEYRQGKLKLRLREGFLDGRAARESLRAACQQRGLKLEFDAQEASTVTVEPA